MPHLFRRLSASVVLLGLVSLVNSSGCNGGAPPSDSGEAGEVGENGSTDASGITGTAPRATGGFPSVVMFDPVPAVEYPLPPEPALMDQYNTDFHPRMLIVRAGQTVQFKNSEDTLHNVHVRDTVTRETAFNVATPVEGAYEYVFETPGVYDVSCGVHPSMAAFIVVTETPYAVSADRDGGFSLAGVPPGTYTVTVWNLDPSRRSVREITVGDGPAELVLDEMS